MSVLVGNPEDRFSHNEAQICVVSGNGIYDAWSLILLSFMYVVTLTYKTSNGSQK